MSMRFVRLLTWSLPWLLCSLAAAQDLEPRRWSHLPVGTNVLGITYAYTAGDIAFDPAIRIDDADFRMSTVVTSYVRSFALLDRTARLDVQLPVQSGHWEGLLDGVPRAASRDGLGDPIVRLSVNLVGAPPLKDEAFMAYRRQHPVTTVIGAGLQVRVPLGEYREARLINLGRNRFVLRPQLGVLHTNGPWSFELTGSVFVYTDNDDFFNGGTFEQDPLYTAQAHVVRTFKDRTWISAGIAYAAYGETTVNGQRKDDDSSVLLYGISCGFPIGARQSLRFTYFRQESFTDTGQDTNNFLIGWSIRF